MDCNITPKYYLRFIFFVLLIFSCKKEIPITDTMTVDAELIYEDTFDQNIDHWVVEQMPGGTVVHTNRKMEITDAKGCTVWFREQLKAPLLIEYDAIVIKKDGDHDRVSDLNCFWLTTDPARPDNFFKTSDEGSGKFKNYDSLQLYYVGLGGHHNTKTRFRKYSGNGLKPLLPEHDLSNQRYLITPNIINHIKIVVYQNHVQYYRNDLLIYDF